MKRRLLFLAALCALALGGQAQNANPDSLHWVSVEENLRQVELADSGYAAKIDISVSRIPLVELLRNIGKASDLNINANLPPTLMASCDFKQIRVADLLLFLCREHSLDADAMGNILTLSVYTPRPPDPEIRVAFNPATRKVSFDFTAAALRQVAARFSQVCGCNLIVPQQMFNQKVSAYGKDMTLDEGVVTIAAVNSMRSRRQGENSWTLFRADGGRDEADFFRMDEIKVDSLGLITAKITNGNIQNIVQDIARKMRLNYFLADNLSHPTNIYVDNVDLDEFFRVLFTGTNFTWRYESGIYVFGAIKGDQKLSSVSVFPLKYRTVEKVQELIPAELKQGVEVITFPDLNSLIISGDQRKTLQVLHFLREIDKSVPLISIDVIIVDATNKYSQDLGISLGLGTSPTATEGTLSPGVNMNLGAGSVNNVINSLHGFGPLNLGKVTSNFYAKLQFMEENGYINLRSTPRLATLNGNKATLKSGEKKYYKEIQTNIIGTQNPMQSESYQWKPVEANFTLDITPYVSLDSCITLTIDLSQSEFTVASASTEDAPPGTTTRSFNSIIKVHNQDMVLLGGIERTQTQRTSRGLPFLSRVPILRWLFGSTNKGKSTQKLNIFIKPTIIE
ncbi:MAG: type II secretion system protein GspD [Mediterranea sp.]|jgi:type IV pilus assembly protein PilQ|nr:type II secretion system protein GspD [Mediterranea sp.]